MYKCPHTCLTLHKQKSKWVTASDKFCHNYYKIRLFITKTWAEIISLFLLEEVSLLYKKNYANFPLVKMTNGPSSHDDSQFLRMFLSTISVFWFLFFSFSVSSADLWSARVNCEERERQNMILKPGLIPEQDFKDTPTQNQKVLDKEAFQRNAQVKYA